MLSKHNPIENIGYGEDATHSEGTAPDFKEMVSVQGSEGIKNNMAMKIVLYVCDDSITECVKRLDKDNALSFCYDRAYKGNMSLNSDVAVEELSVTDFDYLIIVTGDKYCSKKVFTELCQKNISKDRLLEYCHFKTDAAVRPIEDFWKRNSSIKYENFVFGMSHSYGGLLTCMIKGTTYKFAAPSMDLYYHYLVLKDLCSNYDMTSVKRVVFELPYYIFNYDLSKCKRTFEIRREYYGYYRDLHNFEGSEEEQRNIFMNEIWYGLCEERKSRSVPESDFLRKQYLKIRYFGMRKPPHCWTAEEKEYISDLHPHVWYREYEETIEENIYIWRLIREILGVYKNIDIKVCVFPFCSFFVKKNREAIERNKKFSMNT